MEEYDTDLVRSILAGNQHDFRKLWDRYHLDAERWAFQHIRNPFEAEEIAQEAFAEAYSNLATLREPHKFSGWLSRIVANIAVSRIRRRRKMIPIETMSGIYRDGTWIQIGNRYEAPSPGDVVEEQEQDRRLQAAVSRLPSIYKRVITMFYFDDRSYKDIAAQLELPVTTIKGMLYRARQRLRKELVEDE